MQFTFVSMTLCLGLLFSAQDFGSAAFIAVARPMPRVIIPAPVLITRVGFMGKREANENRTECTMNGVEKKLTCTGEHELSCDVSTRLNYLGGKPLSVIVKDLIVKLVEKAKKGEEILMKILAEKEVDRKISIEEYTFVSPVDNKPVHLSLYSSDNLKDKLGFQFKDDSCLKKFKALFNNETKRGDFNFKLIIKQENGEESSAAETTTASMSADSTTAETAALLAEITTAEAKTAALLADTTTAKAKTAALLADTTTAKAETAALLAEATTAEAKTAALLADTTTAKAETAALLAESTTHASTVTTTSTRA